MYECAIHPVFPRQSALCGPPLAYGWVCMALVWGHRRGRRGLCIGRCTSGTPGQFLFKTTIVTTLGTSTTEPRPVKQKDMTFQYPHIYQKPVFTTVRARISCSVDPC